MSHQLDENGTDGAAHGASPTNAVQPPPPGLSIPSGSSTPSERSTPSGSSTPSGRPLRGIRTFGRRTSRPLSPRKRWLIQESASPILLRLPSLAAGDQSDPVSLGVAGTESLRSWASSFPMLEIDIGFGKGDQLLYRCLRSPEIGFIGIEPFETGVVATVNAAEQAGIQNLRVLLGAADAALITSLTEVLSPCGAGSVADGATDRTALSSSVGRITLLNPDPWPKTRHHKRRLIQPDFLHTLLDMIEKTHLRPAFPDIPDAADGEVLLSTDHAGYAAHIVEVLASMANIHLHTASTLPTLRRLGYPSTDSQTATIPWQPTKYERKASSEGRSMRYFRFQRVREEIAFGGH
ncbi:MAG: hypothetical protein K0U36_06290 [Alphaproteobacteria bacterium]|nr:hypothetical protein [Alphaproteobacteria bacterium]